MLNYCVMHEKQCFGEHNLRTTINKVKTLRNNSILYVFGTYNSFFLSFLAGQKEKQETDYNYVVLTDLEILYSE